MLCEPDFKRKIKTNTGRKREREVDVIIAIVQDANTKEILMQGFMNKEAWHCTIKSSRVNFWSLRTDKLWEKGAISGNFVEVVSIQLDCDRDAALIQGVVHGSGNICHTGNRSCFYVSAP